MQMVTERGAAVNGNAGVPSTVLHSAVSTHLEGKPGRRALIRSALTKSCANWRPGVAH